MTHTMKHGFAHVLPVLLISALVGTIAGCQTGGQTGALAGGGIGALAGQLIGGNTKGTLIGAAIGTGVGYMIGNEKDKAHAREMSRSSRSRNYAHHEVGNLGGTRWFVISLKPSDVVEPWSSKVVEFQRDGHVRTTTTKPDGTVESRIERYRVVGDTLILNNDGYVINSRYSISGNELIISAEEFSAVLLRQ